MTSHAQLRRARPVGQVRPAGLGGDREARRDRQPELRHLGEVGALAAQQVLLVLVAFGEVVDVLRWHRNPFTAPRPISKPGSLRASLNPRPPVGTGTFSPRSGPSPPRSAPPTRPGRPASGPAARPAWRCSCGRGGAEHGLGVRLVGVQRGEPLIELGQRGDVGERQPGLAADREALEVPGDVLAHVDAALGLAEGLDQQRGVAAQHRARPRAGRAARAAGGRRSAAASSANSHGRPRQPRPTTTPSQPVSAIIRTASCACQMSPLPSTGIVQGVLEPADRRPVRRAAVELRRRAPVQGHPVHTLVLGDRGRHRR